MKQRGDFFCFTLLTVMLVLVGGFIALSIYRFRSFTVL